MVVNKMVQTVRRLLRAVGFDVIRYPVTDLQLDLYTKLYTHYELQRRPFYNVGPGTFSHPHWTNIDIPGSYREDCQSTNVIEYNMMELEPLPLSDGDAYLFYSSHAIEHVTDEAVLNLFREVYRCLKNKGLFRITAPDAELAFDALERHESDWFYWDNRYSLPGSYEHNLHKPANSIPLEERWLAQFASPLAPNVKMHSNVKFAADEIRSIINDKGRDEALEFFASHCHFDPDRIGNHINWWTHEKLVRFLREAGFSSVYRSGYGQSASPILRNTYLFDSTHPQMSLYMEAWKT